MKRIFLFLPAGVLLILSCNKHNLLPAYKPAIPVLFSVNNKMAHTADTVNIGDTIYITASGTIADTTNTFSFALKVYSGTVSAAGVFTSSGNLAAANFISPLPKVISAPGASALFGWTSAIALPVPVVAHKTNILISATFENSVSLSSQYGNQVASDSKAIYVR